MPDLAQHQTIRTEQREVTLLFADLRGFTELAAMLEANPLVGELLANVMDCLTEAVLDHHGHVVDYFGDGLMAMWNAPGIQPSHPELACQAAMSMLEALPTIGDDWAGAVQSNLRLGIGLHTGQVQVGNAGSTQRAKYGPRGPNVHLAARVEAATKELRLPLIATTTTVQRLSGFAAHRVCRAQLPGLQVPTDLYSVRRPAADDSLASAWRYYDVALRHFEQGKLSEAAAALEAIDTRISDVPWRFLASEVQRSLGRQHNRRSTDTPAVSARGVVTLTAK